MKKACHINMCFLEKNVYIKWTREGLWVYTWLPLRFCLMFINFMESFWQYQWKYSNNNNVIVCSILASVHVKSTYLLIKTGGEDWTVSRQRCLDLGWDLALIKDSAELEDVKLYVNGSGGYVIHQSAGLIIVRRHVRKVSRYQKG
jgi:hypothetical protein